MFTELFQYLWYTLKKEVKTFRFYLLTLIYLLVFGVFLLLFYFSNAWNSQNALINGLALSFLMTALMIIATLFLRRFIRRKRKTDQLRNMYRKKKTFQKLNEEEKKIYLSLLEEKKNPFLNEKRIITDWCYWLSFLWYFIGFAITLIIALT